MDFRDIQNLSEAYLGIYEAKSDKNLTPLEKERERNYRRYGSSDEYDREENTAERRLHHSWERGEPTKEKPVGNRPTKLSPKYQSRDYNLHRTLELVKQRNARKPKNKIVPFHREELEYLISHLLDEGYATNLESAENIVLHMSEGWKTDVLKSLARGTKRLTKRASKSKFVKKANKFLTRTALGALGVPFIS